MQLNKYWLIPQISAIIVGLLFATLIRSGAVASLGQNIPQTDILADYVTGVLLAVCIGLIILFIPFSPQTKRGLIIIWILKTLVTLGFMLFYEAYYDVLDVYGYFNLPRQDFKWAGFSLFGKGNGSTENIYNLVWLYYKVLPESYHGLKVSFALIGLIATYVFYQGAVLFLQREDVRFLYGLGLYPSLIFWSAIIGKDPISFLAIAFYTYGVIGTYRHKKPWYVFVTFAGLFLAIFVRTWLGVILLLPVTILSLQSIKNVWIKSILLLLTSSSLVLAFKILQTQFGIVSYQDVGDKFFLVAGEWSDMWFLGKNLPTYLTETYQVIAFIPLGMLLTLFRPFPGDPFNPFSWLSLICNLPLLILLGLAFARTKWQDFKEPLVLWATVLIITWAGIYAFTSSDRYRIQILPILLGLLLYLGRKRVTKTLNNDG